MTKQRRELCFNPSQVRFTLQDNDLWFANLSKVSIPHRYDSHYLSFIENGIRIKFQSLTGTIHTFSKSRQRQISHLFQSLTGTIHTIRSRTRNRRYIIVSIPHRYDSHFFRFPTFSIVFLVSIPHRYDSHEVILKTKPSFAFCFNPSQVRFTQILDEKPQKGLPKFQSLTGTIHTGIFKQACTA